MATTAEPKEIPIATLRALDAQSSELLNQIRSVQQQVRDANYTIGQRFGQRRQEDIYGLITHLTNLQSQYADLQTRRTTVEAQVGIDREEADRIAAERRRVEERKREVLAELNRLEHTIEDIHNDRYLRLGEKDDQVRGLLARVGQAQDELQQITNQEARLEYSTEVLRDLQVRTMETGTEAKHEDAATKLQAELVTVQTDHATRRGQEQGLTYRDMQIEASQTRLELLLKDEVTALRDGNYTQARNIRNLRELEAAKLTALERPTGDFPDYYKETLSSKVATLYRKNIDGYQFNGAAGRLSPDAYIRNIQLFDTNFAQNIVNELGPEALAANKAIPEFDRAITTVNLTREAEAQAAREQAEQQRAAEERERVAREQAAEMRRQELVKQQENAKLARRNRIDAEEMKARTSTTDALQNQTADQQQTAQEAEADFLAQAHTQEAADRQSGKIERAMYGDGEADQSQDQLAEHTQAAQDTETDFMALAQDEAAGRMAATKEAEAAAAELKALEQTVGLPQETTPTPVTTAPEAITPEAIPEPEPPTIEAATAEPTLDLAEPEVAQLLQAGGMGEPPPGDTDTPIKLDVSTLSPAGELGLLADFSHFAKEQHDQNPKVSFDAICKRYAADSEKAQQFFGQVSTNPQEEQARLAAIETYYSNGLADFANITSPDEFLAYVDIITDNLDKARDLADQAEARKELSTLPQFDQLNQMREEMLKRGAGKGLKGLDYDQQVFATYLKNRANRIYAEKLVPDIVDHRKETVTHLLKDQLRQTLGLQTLPPEVGAAVDGWYSEVVARGQVPSAANGRLFVDNLANPPQGTPNSSAPNYLEARRSIDSALQLQGKTFTPTQDMASALAGNIYTVPINSHIAGLTAYQQTVTSLGAMRERGLARVAPLEGGIAAGAQISGEAKTVELKLLATLKELHDKGQLNLNDAGYQKLISRDPNGHLNKQLRSAAFAFRNQFAIMSADQSVGPDSLKTFNETVALSLKQQFGNIIKGDVLKVCEQMAVNMGDPELVDKLEEARLYHYLAPAAAGDKQAQSQMVTSAQAVSQNAQAKIKALESDPTAPPPTEEALAPLQESQAIGEQAASTMIYLPRVVEDTIATNTLLEQERVNAEPATARPQPMTYFQRYVAEHPKYQAETPQEQQADMEMAKYIDSDPKRLMQVFDVAQIIVMQQYAAAKGQVHQASVLSAIIRWYITEHVKLPVRVVNGKIVALKTYKKEMQDRTKRFLRKYTPSFLHLDFVLSNKYMKVLWSASPEQIPQKIAMMAAKDLGKKAWRWAYGGSRLDPFSLINPNAKDPWGEYNKYMKDWERFSGTKRYKFLRRPVERVQQVSRYAGYKTGRVASAPFRATGSWWTKRFGGTTGKLTQPFKTLGRKLANSAVGKGIKLTKKAIAKALLKVGAFIAKSFSTVLTVLSIKDLIMFLKKHWKRIAKYFAFVGASLYLIWMWILQNLPMLIGGAIGAAIGGFLFGPVGALAGAFVGSMVAYAFVNFLLPLFAKGGFLGSLIGGAVGGYFGGFFGGVGGVYMGGLAEFLIRRYVWPKFGSPFQIALSKLLNGVVGAFKGAFDAVIGLINWATSATFGGAATFIAGATAAIAVIATIISIITVIPGITPVSQPALQLDGPDKVQNGQAVAYTLSATLPKCATSVSIENPLPPNTTLSEVAIPTVSTGGLIKTIDAVATASRITWNLTITTMYCAGSGQASTSPQPQGQLKANALDATDFALTIEGQGRNVAMFPDAQTFITAVKLQSQRFPNLADQDAKLTTLYDRAVAQQVNPLAVLAIWGVEASFRSNNSEFGCKPFGNGFDSQVTCSVNTLDKWMSVFEQAQRQPGFTGTVDLPSRVRAGEVCSFTDPFIFAYEKYSPVCVIDDANENARKNFATFYNAFLGG